jgi:hypothetical protein
LKKIKKAKFQAKSKREILTFHKIQKNLRKIPEEVNPSPRENLKRSHKTRKIHWKRAKIQRKTLIQNRKDQDHHRDYKIDQMLKHQHKILRKRTKNLQENQKTKKGKKAKRAKVRVLKREMQK